MWKHSIFVRVAVVVAALQWEEPCCADDSYSYYYRAVVVGKGKPADLVVVGPCIQSVVRLVWYVPPDADVVDVLLDCWRCCYGWADCYYWEVRVAVRG